MTTFRKQKGKMRKMTFKGRSFLTLQDYSKEEILYLLDLAAELKAGKKRGETGHLLEGKNIVLIFDKTSTRTRCSFEVAVLDEGGHATFLTNSQMGKKESVEDTARVLGRLYDGIEYRGFDMDVCRTLRDCSGVPVFNGLTDDDHPTQVLADFMTAREHIGGSLDSMKMAYIGDGRNNVALALMTGAAKVGMDFAVGSPAQLFPAESFMEKMDAFAAQSGSTLTVTTDPYEAVEGADIIYTDVWVSMGEEDRMEERIRLLRDYQVTSDLMAATGRKTIFEHCLPAFHDLNTVISREVARKYGEKYGLESGEMEVTDEVFRSPASVVFDEAENRMHTIKAVLVSHLV